MGRDRYDARRVTTAHDFNALYPYLMKGRNDSVVLFSETINAEPLLEYIQEKKDGGVPVTFFQILLLALIRVLRERPELNRYIMGRRVYQRKAIDVSFVAKREMSDEGGETVVNVRVKEGEPLKDVAARITGGIRSAKGGDVKEDDKLISVFMRMPRFVLRALLKLIECYDFYIDTPKFLRGVDPLRCSAFVANLGSVGIEAPFHHLYEWGTCSLFMAVGKIKPTPYVTDDGAVAARRMVEIKLSLDERIADGFYCARSLDLFKRYLQDPSLLEL
ncbi:MAG: 2-oxo acid dehydrogenase subunit E2 [Oscillospiraceae bacterium]|nr:2-oxo acid dehydrogenase subunit E2 [Oscillospiraceae bacterium]